MDIVLTRGDTRVYTFTIVTEDGVKYVLGEKDKLYFTIKKRWFDKGCVLQKTFGNGITYDEDKQVYVLEFTHNCTCDIDCIDYVWDIELFIGNEEPPFVATLAKGKFVVDFEATHKENET